MTFNPCGTWRLLAATTIVLGCATPPPPAPIYVSPPPPPPAPLSDPGPASATALTLPFTQHDVVGTITRFNARWYRFRVPGAGKISLSLIGDGSPTDLDLYLYRSMDVHFHREPPWSSRDVSNSEVIAADLLEGTYYVYVPIAEKSVNTTTFTLRGHWTPDLPLQTATVPGTDRPPKVGRRFGTAGDKPKVGPTPTPRRPVKTDPVPKPAEIIPPAVDPGRSSALEIASGTARQTELTIDKRIVWFKVIVRELSDVTIVITAETDGGEVAVSALDQTLSMTGTRTIQRREVRPGTYYIRLTTSLPRAHSRVTVKASVLDPEGFLSRD